MTVGALTLSARPRLSSRARLEHDSVRDRPVLLMPEGVLVLNATAAAIVSLCDGQRTVSDIAAALGAQYRDPVEQDVLGLLNRLAARRLVEAHVDDDR